MQCKMMRENVALEFLKTERTYVDKLRVFSHQVCKLLKVRQKTVMSTKNRFMLGLLSSVPTITSLNEKLLGDLEDQGINGNLGQVMCNFAPFLKVYTTYLQYVSGAAKYLKNNPQVKQFFTLQMKKYAFDMDDCMIAPVQRLAQYKMLLDKLRHCTPASHTDAADLQEAYIAVCDAATHCDTHMQQFECIDRLKKFEWSCDVTHISTFRLIKEGILRKVVKVGMASAVEGKLKRVVLLSESFAYGKDVSGGRVIVKKVVPLHCVDVIATPDLGSNFETKKIVALWIRETSKNYLSYSSRRFPLLLFQARTKLDAEDWRKAIKSSKATCSVFRSQSRIKRRSTSALAGSKLNFVMHSHHSIGRPHNSSCNFEMRSGHEIDDQKVDKTGSQCTNIVVFIKTLESQHNGRPISYNVVKCKFIEQFGVKAWNKAKISVSKYLKRNLLQPPPLPPLPPLQPLTSDNATVEAPSRLRTHNVTSFHTENIVRRKHKGAKLKISKAKVATISSPRSLLAQCLTNELEKTNRKCVFDSQDNEESPKKRRRGRSKKFEKNSQI